MRHYNTAEENHENTTQIKQLTHKATSQYQLELADSDRLLHLHEVNSAGCLLKPACKINKPYGNIHCDRLLHLAEINSAGCLLKLPACKKY